jgi:hypothetical protein
MNRRPRLLHRINTEQAKRARREYYDRDPDHGTWSSYQHDQEFTDAQVIERARDALGAELVLTFDRDT